ncbi:hypothetical protein Ancab_029986, partial [Ancistrocladus abbreviatus]
GDLNPCVLAGTFWVKSHSLQFARLLLPSNTTLRAPTDFLVVLLQEASQTFQTDIPLVQNMGKDSLVEPKDNGNKSNNAVQITDEQKARMEANKLKALERASARARLSSTA